MGHRTLLPDIGEVVVDQLGTCRGGRLIMVLRPARPGSRCPLCRLVSLRIHSRYSRRLNDLPWEGIPVRIELRVRRFFCDNDACSQRIFTEQLPQTAPRYARRTGRLTDLPGKGVQNLPFKLLMSQEMLQVRRERASAYTVAGSLTSRAARICC
jgi:transposase